MYFTTQRYKPCFVSFFSWQQSSKKLFIHSNPPLASQKDKPGFFSVFSQGSIHQRTPLFILTPLLPHKRTNLFFLSLFFFSRQHSSKNILFHSNTPFATQKDKPCFVFHHASIHERKPLFTLIPVHSNTPFATQRDKTFFFFSPSCQHP